MATAPASSSTPGGRFARDRTAALANFYANEADALHHALARTVNATDTMLEDACGHAWCQLVRNDEVEIGPGAFWWLYVVAQREVFRLTRRARREPASGSPRDLPARAGVIGEDAGETVERRIRHQARVGMLDSLAARRRSMVILCAAGFSYDEIAERIGTTARTVERQLARGRHTLRELDAAACAG